MQVSPFLMRCYLLKHSDLVHINSLMVTFRVYNYLLPENIQNFYSVSIAIIKIHHMVNLVINWLEQISNLKIFLSLVLNFGID